MKKKLTGNFKLFMSDPVERLTIDKIEEFKAGLYDMDKGYAIPFMPMQVHEVLIFHGVIPDPGISGNGEDCRWVSEKDWIYVLRITGQETGVTKEAICRLHVGGVDTLADIYWNGMLEGQGEDVYLPIETDITGKVEDINFLLIHVHSTWDKLRRLEIPARYLGNEMPKWAMLRVFFRGYDNYLGFPPYLTRMGTYDDVWLEFQGIHSLDINTEVSRKKCPGTRCNGEAMEGRILLETECLYNGEEETFLLYKLYEEDVCVLNKIIPADKEKRTSAVLEVKNPRLWNVIHKGEAFLYDLKISLLAGEHTIDEIHKKIGFRSLELAGDLDFRINGMPLKIWGANMAPLDNKTGCYQKERAEKIIQMAIDGNMNCLRIWGGTDRLPDSFYDMCDKAGLLLWQDFFHDYSMYPEEEHFRELCRKEAEYQVRRLRYHPCILLWCGSNESLMCRDFMKFTCPGQECIGYGIYAEDYQKICRKWDPERYYHLSSPSGGTYANDPLEGDTHSYTSTWFVPGGRYPVFLSENMRAFPPVYHSMVKMMGEKKLWPAGYTGKMTKGSIFPWPKTWRPYTSADSWKKISEVEQFYDADSAESMIYRFQGSAARYIEKCAGRYRRGRSFEERGENKRKCKGHLWWKMNTSAPHIYSGLLDYYMEPSIPYYAMKRTYQPFQLFFSIDDFIGLWAVNDTVNVIKGTVYVKLYHMKENRATALAKFPFQILPDQSLFISDLNAFGQFMMNENILFAKAVDEEGKILTVIYDYADIERHMEFPDCKLELFWDNEELVIETDYFARSITLSGDENGDNFGWQFSDNYFDLLPGEAKRITVGGEHKTGWIHAKGYYSSQETTVAYEDHFINA